MLCSYEAINIIYQPQPLQRVHKKVGLKVQIRSKRGIFHQNMYLSADVVRASKYMGIQTTNITHYIK